jgi:hypothetical protein
MDRQQLADLLGTDRKTVTRKCSEIGLVQGRGTGKPRFWNEERCEFLRSRYNGSNAKELAVKLGLDNHRKLYSILSKLGLSKTRKYVDEGLGEVDGDAAPSEEWRALSAEEWPEEADIFANYEFSSLGRVRNMRLQRVLRLHAPDGLNGYVRFEVGGKNYVLHIIIAKAFLGRPEEGKVQVNHIDGVKTNNAPSNLEWMTASQNTQHAYRTGLISRGRSRLSDAQIHQICAYLRAGKPQVQITEELGIALSWRNAFYSFKNCTYRPDITKLYFGQKSSVTGSRRKTP